MTGRLLSRSRWLILLGIAFFLFGCALTSPVQVEPTAVGPVDIPAPTLPVEVPEEEPEEAPVEEPTFAPTAAGSGGANDIQVDYVYTNNLITILYPLYGSTLDDFVVINLTNHNAEAVKLIIQSEVTGYTTQSIDTVTVDANGTLEVRQNPRLIPEAIDKLNVARPAQFHLSVVYLDNGVEKPVLDETGETQVYARRDFPWSIPGFNDEEVWELTAAMVTPNDPAVEELLRYAADYTDSGIITGGYSGYLNDEGGKVWDRLEAIWQAEEEIYNLTYINTWVSYAPGSVQRIRLPAEVLDQRSGNCIELAALYAAAAEAMDLETALIGIPGHAFVAVRTDMENANYYFIETTLIGRATFAEAIEVGNQEFEEALPHMDAKEDYYRWVTVQTAREKGILPLPWH